MSGRTLRRLPVLAHARHISLSAMPDVGGKATRLETWIGAMEKVVDEERIAMQSVKDGGTTDL
jgi:hypothetical protein